MRTDAQLDGKFRGTVTPLLSWRRLLPATRTCPARSLGLFLGQLFKVESLSVSSRSPLFSTLRRSVLLSVVSSAFTRCVSSHSCPRPRAVSLSKSTDFLSGPSVGGHFRCFSLPPPSRNEPRAQSLLLFIPCSVCSGTDAGRAVAKCKRLQSPDWHGVTLP